MSPSPPTGEALHAFARILVPYLAPLLALGPARPFSQGELPSGCGKAKYLRTWRKARDGADPGAWAEGRARLMTAECWAKWSRTPTPKSTARPVVAPKAPSLLEELGAKRVSR